MSRILIVEHEAGAPAALFDGWLRETGAEVIVCRPWAGEEVPPLPVAEGWVVLGGHMGAYDDEQAPWLPAVKARIAEAAETRVSLLGICLGHQLAAVATGGTVIVNPAGQRVGLHDVGWLPEADEDPLMGALDGSRRAVQWNGDIVTELGPGAVPLASLPNGELQAARFAPTVWGVQWHPEADLPVVRGWADGQREDHLDRGLDSDAILAEIEAATPELEASWRPLAAAFVAQLEPPR